VSLAVQYMVLEHGCLMPYIIIIIIIKFIENILITIEHKK